MAGSIGEPCGKLPIPLTVCPCCHAGIKPARGWTWVDYELIREAPCSIEGCKGCYPFDGSVQRFGLLWIGEKFYPTPESFKKECAAMGISRRISAIPKDFKLGETWVLVAHRKAIRYDTIEWAGPEPVDETKWTSGIFQAFKPTAIEYVVKEGDTEEKLEFLEKRGITLVRVHPKTEQTKINLTNGKEVSEGE